MAQNKNMISEVMYNQSLDTYEVYLFGAKVMDYADETVAQEHSISFIEAYSQGRRDVTQLLANGHLELEDLILLEKQMVPQEPTLNPFALHQEGDEIELIPHDLIQLDPLSPDDEGF